MLFVPWKKDSDLLVVRSEPDGDERPEEIVLPADATDATVLVRRAHTLCCCCCWWRFGSTGGGGSNEEV